MSLGSRLKYAREERGLSQRELARVAQVDHTWISRVEEELRHNISFEAAKRLAHALGVTLDYLAERDDQQHPVPRRGRPPKRRQAAADEEGPMPPDPLRHMDDHMAAINVQLRALQASVERFKRPSGAHRVAFVREPDGIRAVCTDCLGKGKGPTVEAARAAVLADIRRLQAEARMAQPLPEMWEETLTLDEAPGPALEGAP